MDEATRVWRAASASAEVEILITPAGRACGRGIELAVALAQRGVPVTFNPIHVPEDAAGWVDGTGKDLEYLSRHSFWPPPPPPQR